MDKARDNGIKSRYFIATPTELLGTEPLQSQVLSDHRKAAAETISYPGPAALDLRQRLFRNTFLFDPSSAGWG